MRMSDPKALAAAVLLASLTMLFRAAPLPAAEATAAGLWQKQEEGRPVGWFLFVERDGVYEGIIAKIFPEPGGDPDPNCRKCPDDRKDMPIIGLPLVRDMKRNGLKYEGGNVIDPRNGKIYNAIMTVSPAGDTLTLRGYLGIAMFGKDEVWQRLPDSAIGQLDRAVIAKYLPAHLAQPPRPDAAKKAAPTR